MASPNGNGFKVWVTRVTAIITAAVILSIAGAVWAHEKRLVRSETRTEQIMDSLERIEKKLDNLAARWYDTSGRRR